MKKNLYFLNTIMLFVVVVVFVNLKSIPTFASTCLQINSDIGYGQTDSVTNASIKQLQTYLQLNGFFGSNPNGHFGSATLVAVKAFQTTSGISATGYVGPKTRAYIKQKTCNVDIVSNTPVITTQTLVQSSVQVPVPIISNTNITSPTTGQILSIGKSVPIRWNTSPTNPYDLSLEQPGGVGAGFIASSLDISTINGNQYVWNVGKVFSSQTNSSQTIIPGTYRIRMQNSVSGASSTDQTSGWFTVVAPQFSVSSVVPSSVYADNTTSVVLFGVGLNLSTSVYFDSNYSNLRANNTYVSPDGTVVIFTVPTTVPVGSHTLYVNNAQNASPVMAYLTIIPIQ